MNVGYALKTSFFMLLLNTQKLEIRIFSEIIEGFLQNVNESTTSLNNDSELQQI